MNALNARLSASAFRLPSVLRGWLLGLCLLLVTATAAPVASEVRPFTSESFGEIRRSSSGHPLVIAFWSTHCEPCKEELSLLAQLHHEFPSVAIILVDTDAPAERVAVQRFLAKYELGNIAVWQFGDEAEDRIRYSVDPTWRGELPRSYFFDKRGAVTKRSGVPDEASVRRWFERARRSGFTPDSVFR